MREFAFMDSVERVDAVLDFGDDREGLSPLLRELEQLIGMEATLALVDRWGGIQLYVPMEIPPGHAIEGAVGREAAVKLSGYCGGDHVSIPLARVYRRIRRDHEIFRKKRAGKPAHVLAREYGMTQRNIWQVIANQKDLIAKQKYKRSMEAEG